jgi:hypothetical protein
MAAAFAGVLLARAFLRNVSTEKFRKVLMVALVVFGVSFIAQGLRG